MKKFSFLIFLFIFFIFAGIGYAFHMKFPDSIIHFNDIINKHKKNVPKNENKNPDIKENDIIKSQNTAAPKSLIFSFAGDVLLDGNVASLLKKSGTEFIISDVKSILKASDISMINLENPISLRGTKAKNKQYTFRVNPKYMDVLTSSGIDIVTLANNHSLDFGTEALLDTFDNLDSINVRYVGAGKDIDSASRPYLFDKNGYKTSILGSSHVIPEVSWNAGAKKPGLATTYNPARLVSEISKAKKNSDIVVVYIHWGEERKTTPLNYQKNLAKKYIDSGADIVIGSHPHVLQGFEFYKGKLIAYSLGNFIFTDLKKDTMILNIKYTDNTYKASIVPCKIEKYRPIQIKDKNTIKSFYKNLESISFNVKINDNGEILPYNSAK